MKGIVIAAGMGNRLRPLTKQKPKCMLELGGKPIIQHQIDVLRSLGIKDLSIIKGYHADKIDLKSLNIKYYLNENYQSNNILESLFYAEQEIEGDVIILYSDIIFNMRVVEKLLESDEEISIVVDVDWKKNYINRLDHPIDEAENVVFDEKRYLNKIGKTISVDKGQISGEFIGMLKLCGQGALNFKKLYHESRAKYLNGPFQKAPNISQAYLTDLLQEIVDCGNKVYCVQIHNGWKEIDTYEDYQNAVQIYENKKF